MEPLALHFCKTTQLSWIRFVGCGVVRRIYTENFELNSSIALPVVTRRWADCSVATSHIDRSCSGIEFTYRPLEDG